MLPSSSRQIKTRIPSIQGNGLPSDTLYHPKKKAKHLRGQSLLDPNAPLGYHKNVTVKGIHWRDDGRVAGTVSLNGKSFPVVKTGNMPGHKKHDKSIGLWSYEKAV